MIIKHLPLLRCTFIHLDFLLLDLLSSDDFFDPVFKLYEDFPGAWFVEETGGTAIAPLHLYRVVVVSVLVYVVGVVTGHYLSLIVGFPEFFPKLASHLS